MQNDGTRSELLKMDVLGRVRVSAQRREALLDAFESCGVSGVEFAAHIGVKYQTFATWRQKRDRQRQACGASVIGLPISAPSTRTEMQWLEAVVENPGSAVAGKTCDRPKVDCVLSIALPGGARVELSDADQVELVAELLRALEAKGRVAC